MSEEEEYAAMLDAMTVEWAARSAAGVRSQPVEHCRALLDAALSARGVRSDG